MMRTPVTLAALDAVVLRRVQEHLAPQSPTMYATSSAVSRVDTGV
jgi:hypothetical protein